MLASDSTKAGAKTSLLGKRTRSPPVAMRSTKSVISQVRDTLFSFIKSATEDSSGECDSLEVDRNATSVVNSQRTLEAFTDRVKSFSVANWMGKPLCLSPPLLAQYGWQCIGIDTVKCCSCSAVFCVRLPWPSADNYRQQCYNYRQRILTAHMKICAWPSYPCSDSFVLPFLHGGHSANDLCAHFVERKNNLLSLGLKLPQLDLNILEDLNLQRASLKRIASTQSFSCSVGASLNTEVCVDPIDFSKFSELEVATILAVCGWDIHASISHSLCCKSSGRIVRLRNFFALNESMHVIDDDNSDQHAVGKIVKVSDDMPSEIFESPPKKIKADNEKEINTPSPLKLSKQNFHPLHQHCPWSSWVVVLKPISKDEFEDADKNTHLQNEEKFKFVVSPALKEAKPGWRVVRDALFGSKLVADRTSRLPLESNKGSPSDEPVADKAEESAVINVEKTPAKSAVAHVRKLLKEWSSPK